MDLNPSAILSWLSTQDDEATKQLNLKERLPGTADWILDTPELTLWISGLSISPILWCYGLPGTGKSMLSSVIVDHLESQIRHPEEALAYVYSNYDKKVTALDLLSSICKQLASQCLNIPWQLIKLYSQMSQEERRPDIDEIMLLIVSMCDTFSRVFIIVDGLGGVLRDWGLVALIEKLQWMRNHGAKILVSSGTHGDRPEPCGCLEDIENAFRDETQLLIRPRQEDILTFVEHKLKEHGTWVPLLLNARISVVDFVRRVAIESGGVFIVADLQVKRALRALEASNHARPHLTHGLPPETLGHFLDRASIIEHQPYPKNFLWNWIRNWVIHAVVPLTILELAHAVTLVSPSDFKFYISEILSHDAIIAIAEIREDKSENELEETISIIRLCEGLIRVTDDQHVSLWVDYTFSEEQRKEMLGGAQFRIALSCLLLISEDILVEWNHDPFDKPTADKVPILDYCQKHWAAHFLACTEDDDLEVLDNLALDYLQRIHKKPARWIETRQPMFDKSYQVLVTDDETPILKAARFGLNRVLEKLIEDKEYDINAQSWKKQTAISVAVTAQNHSTVQLLYRHGASIHYKNEYGDSLLHLSVQKDDEVMTALLLNSGLAPDTAGGREFETPFRMAANRNSVRSGRILLKENVNTQGAMEAAAGAGALDFVKLLVEHGCNFAIPGVLDARSTALGEAIRSGSVPLVEYMIANGADVTEQDDRRRTPVHIAAWYGNLDIIKTLVDHGADPFAVDDGSNDVCEGDSAMSGSIRGGHQQIVDFLLSRLTPTISEDSILGMAVAAVSAREPNLSVLNLVLPMIPRNIEHSRKFSKDTLLGSAVNCVDETVLAQLLANGIPLETRDEQGWTTLHWAAHLGKGGAVETLLKFGANPNWKSKHGMTPLHIAAYQDKVDVIVLLLNQGADVCMRASDGSTPLVAAAYGSKKDAVRLLLNHDSPLNYHNIDGETTVHCAVMDNDVELLEEILRHRPDLLIQSWRAGSPLHLAAFRGSTEIVKLLITHGADVEQGFEYHGNRYHPPEEYGWDAGVSWNRRGNERERRPHKNWCTIKSGWRPLHSAVCGGHIEVVQFLLEHGSKLSSKSETGETVLHIAASACFPSIVAELLKRGASISEANSEGDTPIHSVASALIAATNTEMENRHKCACTLRHEEEERHGHDDHSKSDCVTILLDHGADINGENSTGFTPLLLAVQAGNKEVVDTILDHDSFSSGTLSREGYLKLIQQCGPKSDATVLETICALATETTESKAAWTELLLKACPVGNHDLVALALERGAVWTRKSWVGGNPFLEAVINGHISTVKLLLDAGASPTEVNELGQNALHLACQAEISKDYKTMSVDYDDDSKYLIVRELLLNYGVYDARTLTGETALHFAVVTGKLSIVRGLIGLGASVNTRNNRGETPLHAAVSTWVFPDIVEHLLLKGSCASAQDLAGNTPLHRIRDRRVEGERAMELLMKHGCDSGIRARNGDMPHHCAVKRGNWELAKRLIELGKLINAKGFRGRTALHIAARKGLHDIIEPLVKLGADWSILDDAGRSPSSYLKERGDKVSLGFLGASRYLR